MSRRSREAVRLARGLSACWGLEPGGVEVLWTDGWFPVGYRQGYGIRWTDGPTVERMRLVAERQVSGEPAIDELVAQGLVRYELSLRAWAVKLAGHVHDGGQAPDLARPAEAEAWLAELERTEFPERARAAGEQTLASRLVEPAIRDYRRAAEAADRARVQSRRPAQWAPPEVLLARAVATEGLEGAASVAGDPDLTGAAGVVVVEPDRYRQVHGLDEDGPVLE